MKITGQLLDEGGGFAFFPYGASWRKLRRIGKKNTLPLYENKYNILLSILLSFL